jgi:L-fuconolactonase
VDLRSPDVAQELKDFAEHPRFVGVRHVLQDEPDDRFMLREDFQRGIAALRCFDLTYDLLVFPRQLPAAIGLAEKFPEQPFVLDHLAKPPIKDGALAPWREQIQALAKLPNVACKVSGLVTEADWQSWRADRLMFGSDWPVCLLAGSYDRVLGLALDYVRRLGPDTEARFFGENAIRFYGLT